MPRIRAQSIEQHKEQTRREILAAAAHLFRSDGYSDTSLADIAALVGVGRTTLYEYFPEKEAILVSLVEEELPGLIEDLLEDLPESLSCRERLGELIVRGLEFVSDHDNLGPMLMRETGNLSREAQRRVRSAHDGLAEALTDVCREGIASGEFRPFDPRDAGRLVYTMMMSASSGLLRSGEAKQRFHEAADTLLRFVFDGLAAP
jgi:AcrR family transcriptional regulator